MKLFGRGGRGNGRKDYAKLPAFSGRVTHYPMATSVLSSP